MAVVVVAVVDEQCALLIEADLVRDEHQVVRVQNRRDLTQATHHGSAEVVLLCPVMAGPNYDSCRELRSAGDVGIIVVSPETDELDELLALASGADDYLQAPYRPRILRARVAAVDRRRRLRGRSANQTVLQRIGSLEVDPEMRTAMISGHALRLTRTEFDLLAALLENRHRVVPRAELIARVWGPWHGDDHVVEVHLSRLRAKVLAGGGPRIGEAVPGYGYRLGGVVTPLGIDRPQDQVG